MRAGDDSKRGPTGMVVAAADHYRVVPLAELVPIYLPGAMTDRQFFDWQTGGGANDALAMIGILEGGAPIPGA